MEQRAKAAYERRLASHGYCAEGVFWASAGNQQKRFAALAKAADMLLSGRQGPFSLADIGCGYGALFSWLQSQGLASRFGYYGVDLSPQMIAACKIRFPRHKALFSNGRLPPKNVSVAVLSGTFNLCLPESRHDTATSSRKHWFGRLLRRADPAIMARSQAEAWQLYILDQLAAIWPLCRHGMALNLLAAERPVIRGGIFHTAPAQFASLLEARFGPVRHFPTPGVAGDFTLAISRHRLPGEH